jgi:23S rRNA (adenine2503-C2)-methyltransferase
MVQGKTMATLEQARGRTEALRRDAEGRIDIKCFDLPKLERFFAEELGLKPTAAKRVFKAIWQRHATSFESMDGVAREIREKLVRHFYLPALTPELVLRSDDGTIKYLWKLEDGSTVESVLIPEEDRLTLCVSSQVGCAMSCSFCLTGDLGLKRHLKPSEIAMQPLQVQADIEAYGGSFYEGRRISNIVMMGMGEPLHNLENLVTALRICMDDDGQNFSHRRITVSTVGLVPKMAELAAALPVNLAVSLNATTEAQRREIMPITRKYSLEELMEACRNFPLPRTKRITFEYVMFEGFNDTLEDADRLVGLLQGIPSKVNLIPYNENPSRDLRRPVRDVVWQFKKYLMARGVNCSIRVTRGIDISAACGQLGKAKEQVEERGWVAEFRTTGPIPN